MSATIRSRRLIGFLLLPLYTLCLCGESPAALDPELKSPYQVHVVLSVAEHRMLTPQFQKRLETDLRDQVQLALGKLAKVEVVHGHALLNDIRTKGLQTVLDGWDELSTVRTLFVLVDFAGGQYRIETGQHDGLTGLSSTVVRREALTDPRRVAETAARLVLNDFGVVGTFQRLDGTDVKVAIYGGGLVDSLQPWLKVGDAFAVVRMSRDGGKLRANPIESAVLQVIEAPRDGHVRCRYFCRYVDDWSLKDDAQADDRADSPALGYRCVKLSTIRGPFKLRLVNDKTQEFLSGFRVVVSGTPTFSGTGAEGATIQGLFETKELFANVAYVRILSGEKALVEFPVPLVDDRTIVCRMSPDATAIKQGEVLLRLNRWVRWSYEALSTCEQRLTDFNNALKGPLEQALKLGHQNLEAISGETTRLTSERAALAKLAGAQKMGVDYSEGDQLAKALEFRHKQLQEYLVELDKLLKEETSDAKRDLAAMVKRAELLEKQADFEQAIQLYDKVLKERPDSAKVKEHLAQLKDAWAIKDKGHEEARRFIYDSWPGLDMPGLKANMAKGKEMFARIQAAGDTKTPLKLVLANVHHATVLTKRLEALRKSPVFTEDNNTEIKALVQLAAELQNLQQKAVAVVTGKDKKSAK
jgi:tetratricopeptide (TPR) repeat protein